MSTNISIIDEYHQGLIAEGAAVYSISPAPAAEVPVATPPVGVEGDEPEAKVVKAPARRKASPKATEGAETK